jgi:hypothetical protein
MVFAINVGAVLYLRTLVQTDRKILNNAKAREGVRFLVVVVRAEVNGMQGPKKVDAISPHKHHTCSTGRTGPSLMVFCMILDSAQKMSPKEHIARAAHISNLQYWILREPNCAAPKRTTFVCSSHPSRLAVQAFL